MKTIDWENYNNKDYSMFKQQLTEQYNAARYIERDEEKATLIERELRKLERANMQV